MRKEIFLDGLRTVCIPFCCWLVVRKKQRNEYRGDFLCLSVIYAEYPTHFSNYFILQISSNLS